MLESRSMDNLLLRMVAPMLHQVVAILFMAGLVHGRKAMEVELKVGWARTAWCNVGLHAFPLCPAVLHCRRLPSFVLQFVVLCAPSLPLSRPAATHRCFMHCSATKPGGSSCACMACMGCPA